MYFSKRPESDADFGAVRPVSRWVEGPAVATAAIAALIDGPTAEEQASGYYSELGSMLRGESACGERDFRIVIQDGLATLTFCRDLASAGVGQDARVQSQLRATLEQFDTVHQVRLLDARGHCLFDQSGLDRCLAGG